MGQKGRKNQRAKRGEKNGVEGKKLVDDCEGRCSWIEWLTIMMCMLGKPSRKFADSIRNAFMVAMGCLDLGTPEFAN
ncbi:hypothetical protein PRIPAC_75427 [Pristionchus pacificus]|uniref:Uncharacterized protein n=1 Tax=Pristionchus pacificus TaxID=54126 RepID=A0A454XQH2_PRIPA|nr:hypothetical protein PRIPAC_75427 [Pristionchus pacificus]|eukprot:PDM81289.1 hypothetical protein PRIPAC_36292 [Pristionchus pacificus]